MFALTVARNPNRQIVACAGHFFHPDIFPGGVNGIVNLNNPVAFADACLGRRAIGHHVTHFGRRRGWQLRKANHEQAGEDSHR